MKKWLALFLVLILIPTCSFAETVAEGIDKYENRYNFTDGVHRIWLQNSYQFTFPYKNKEVTHLGVDIYHASTNLGYYPFVHLKFDVSQLAKKEIEQLSQAFNNIVDSSSMLYPETKYADLNICRSFKMNQLIVNEYNKRRKQLDIVFYSEEASTYPVSEFPYDFSISLILPHSPSVEVLFDSEKYWCDSTRIHVYPGNPLSMSTDLTFKALSDMDSKTYKILKKNLEENGIILE